MLKFLIEKKFLDTFYLNSCIKLILNAKNCIYFMCMYNDLFCMDERFFSMKVRFTLVCKRLHLSLKLKVTLIIRLV